MSPRQYQKFFEKLGFTDVCLASEVWMVVRDEVDQLLKQNGLPRFSEVKRQVWESPNFLELKSSSAYCVETIANKRIFVFESLYEKCPAVFTAKINPTKLADIVESRKLRNTIYFYLPGRALLIYADESRYYDRSPICAKVFKGRVKSQLLDESADLE